MYSYSAYQSSLHHLISSRSEHYFSSSHQILQHLRSIPLITNFFYPVYKKIPGKHIPPVKSDSSSTSDHPDNQALFIPFIRFQWNTFPRYIRLLQPIRSFSWRIYAEWGNDNSEMVPDFSCQKFSVVMSNRLHEDSAKAFSLYREVLWWSLRLRRGENNNENVVCNEIPDLKITNMLSVNMSSITRHIASVHSYISSARQIPATDQNYADHRSIQFITSSSDSFMRGTLLLHNFCFHLFAELVSEISVFRYAVLTLGAIAECKI
jgi:hypothetical protein